MPRTAKLVLPNVETCPWRTLQGEAATCGLIASLLGQCSATVSLEACTACCRSFPPTHRHLNPVVASLLYRAGSEILAAEGTDECDTDRARDVLRQAERSLMIVHPPGMTVTPARLTESCHWLGQPIGTESAASTAEPEWDCLHPSHTVTTSAQCRTCRDWIRQPPISRFLSLSELVPPPRRRCGNKVKEWAVAVTTAPRREPTLAACLDSLVTAGWDRARLFLDGTAPLPDRYSDWPVTWREESVGAWPAWYFALAELVLQQPQADAYVMLQDDVALYPRESLRAYLEEVLWPGDRPGVISLFYTGLNPSTGWFDAKGAWHFSAAGLIFSAGVARTFLCDSDVTRSLLAASGHTHIPIPEILHQWINRQGIDLWYANPSLAQHMGNTSTIWMNAALVNGRRAPWFSGSLEAPFSAKETLDEFPEDAFQCPTATAAEYVQRVENGRRRMRELSVVVCGLCRDVRNFLPRTAARVERLGAMFRDYRVVLFENDSVDATC